MKTEQEQIKAIKQIIDERVETTLGQVQGRHDNVIKTVDTVIIARDIVNAGYGDVTEYKAEIERLRTTLGQCNTELNSALKSLKSQCREIGELKAKIKQAQTDVLNELKRIMTAYSWQIDINDVQEKSTDSSRSCRKNERLFQNYLADNSCACSYRDCRACGLCLP